MATTKNLCAQIPTALHEQVCEAREAAGLTTAQYITNTSIWDGNVPWLATTGVNNHFGKIHTLSAMLGTRTYAVTSVTKVDVTDTSGLSASSDIRSPAIPAQEIKWDSKKASALI